MGCYILYSASGWRLAMFFRVRGWRRRNRAKYIGRRRLKVRFMAEAVWFISNHDRRAFLLFANKWTLHRQLNKQAYDVWEQDKWFETPKVTKIHSECRAFAFHVAYTSRTVLYLAIRMYFTKESDNRSRNILSPPDDLQPEAKSTRRKILNSYNGFFARLIDWTTPESTCNSL
jgi:hypothetical protein